VDAGWVVPHFEKMLYDNALLARVYVHWWRATGTTAGSCGRRTQTCDALLRDFRTEEGAFAAALDADTEGVEGLTYAWSPAAARRGARPDDAAARPPPVGHRGGTFEDGLSTLQRARTRHDQIRVVGRGASALLAARARRPQPFRDDKVIASWNGLAIAALADIGALLDRPDLVDGGRLPPATSRYPRLAPALGRRSCCVGSRCGGVVRQRRRPGLTITATSPKGLLALHQATGEPANGWPRRRPSLLDRGRRSLRRRRTGVLLRHRTTRHRPARADRDSAQRQRRTEPVVRPWPGHCSPMARSPGPSVQLAGVPTQRSTAGGTVAASGTAIRRLGCWRSPRRALPVRSRSRVVGEGPAAQALLRTARASTSPGLVVMHGMPDAPGRALLADRPLVDDGPAAYVCRGFVCDRPVTDTEALGAALRSR
jgi:uncharacterized protein YyaL (SSP411 family)